MTEAQSSYSESDVSNDSILQRALLRSLENQPPAQESIEADSVDGTQMESLEGVTQPDLPIPTQQDEILVVD